MFKVYYQLTKPGIVYGNAITALGGFFLAARGHVNFVIFLAMLLGLSLIIASGCVFNNYIDRFRDAKMERTKNRALVKHLIPNSHALIFATILGSAGSILLFWLTNLLTLEIALLGFFFYVAVYGYAKRTTVHGTLVGSISGSVPPVVGYCAVTNRLDLGAILLFFILVFWQMPHFYAIVMNRMDDYKAAGIPLLPLVHGLKATKVQIVWYTAGFLIMVGLLTVFHYTGYTYLLVMGAIGIIWLWKGIKGFQMKDDKKWGRSMFLFSLKVIMILSVMLSVGSLLP